MVLARFSLVLVSFLTSCSYPKGLVHDRNRSCHAKKTNHRFFVQGSIKPWGTRFLGQLHEGIAHIVSFALFRCLETTHERTSTSSSFLHPSSTLDRFLEQSFIPTPWLSSTKTFCYHRSFDPLGLLPLASLPSGQGRVSLREKDPLEERSKREPDQSSAFYLCQIILTKE